MSGIQLSLRDGMNLYSMCFFSSRRRHTRLQGDWSSDVFFSERRIRHTRLQGDWSSDVCSSDLCVGPVPPQEPLGGEPVEAQDRVGELTEQGGVGIRLPGFAPRSEERRVGKECRSRWSPYH